MRDELPLPTGSSPSSAGDDGLLTDELPDAVLDVIVGGLTTDAALARAAIYDQAGHVPR